MSSRIPLLITSFFLGSYSQLFAQTIQATSTGPGSLALPNATGVDPVESIQPLATGGTHHLLPGALPISKPSSSLPRVFAPTQPRSVYTRFPWKRNITTTVFWIGETPTANNPTPNTVSAWDRRWTSNFGGFDNPSPSAREGYIPKAFTPGQNPFYFALPYNDITRSGTKASARAVVPWFKKSFYRSGRTVLKGRWIAIRKRDRICYAQWEDVGPFETDDWSYVFGDARPKAKKNRGAGLDVSPAVRDFLDFGGGYGTVDWRFVDLDEVPDGPWKQWGANNPFANSSLTKNGTGSASESILKVRELRDRLLVGNSGEDSSVKSIE
ncbi:MAG: hypothetical protein P1U68_15620 [Verrucomicrobiales bacterium]|nr:hypothetical protein [Verrucomicrobiales bacterium]